MEKIGLYNGKTFEEIKNNLPDSMPNIHREEYLKGVKNVITYQKAGISKPLIENIKNFNNHLIKLYL